MSIDTSSIDAPSSSIDHYNVEKIYSEKFELRKMIWGLNEWKRERGAEVENIEWKQPEVGRGICKAKTRQRFWIREWGLGLLGCVHRHRHWIYQNRPATRPTCTWCWLRTYFLVVAELRGLILAKECRCNSALVVAEENTRCELGYNNDGNLSWIRIPYRRQRSFNSRNKGLDYVVYFKQRIWLLRLLRAARPSTTSILL